MKQKNRIVLSALSVILTLTLLAGGTMAWFSDTEQVDANFSAGILDAVVTPENPNEKMAIDFTNLRPMELEQLKADFLDGTPVGNRPGEGFPADNLPLYFHKVNIKNGGTLPMRITLSVEPADPCGVDIKNMVDNGAGGVKQDGTVKCNNGLKNALQLLLCQKDADGTLIVENVPVLWKNGQPVSYVLPETLAANAEEDFILAAWLPSDKVGNAYQAKHFHGSLVVSAAQSDVDVVPAYLNVKYATGSAENTQGYALSQKGSPAFVDDAELGCKVLSLDGRGDAYGYQLQDADYDKMLKSLSIEAYFNANNNQSEQCVFSNQQGSGMGIDVNNGKLQLWIYVNNGRHILETPVETNKWVHAVGTFDGETIKLYCNGELKVSESASGTFSRPPHDTSIIYAGADSEPNGGADWFFHGKIHSVGLYDQALSDTEVKLIYDTLPKA